MQLALSFSMKKQLNYECKTRNFIRKCLQSTWQELGVALNFYKS